MSLRSVSALTLFTAVLCALLMGCSNSLTADVTGKVMVDGQPAEMGSISFIPEDGKSQTEGGEIKDGKYTASKVPLGTMKVDIRVQIKAGKKEVYPGQTADTYKQILPEKYNTKTTLTFEVKPGKNEKDWELATK